MPDIPDLEYCDRWRGCRLGVLSSGNREVMGCCYLLAKVSISMYIMRQFGDG